MMAFKLCCTFMLLVSLISQALGHGRMTVPAARNACAAEGFAGCVRNWNPNEVNCGGRGIQWDKNGGKCGTCGDRYDGEQRHIAGGIFAKGVITKTYKQGQQITVEITITANHQGWFEFRVGDIDAPPITDAKLNHVLKLPGGGTRWSLKGSGKGVHKVSLMLPPGLTCNHCVLRWWWNVGNSWGCDSDGCGNGHGPQETFVNCADIRITKDGVAPPVPPTQLPPPSNAPPPPPQTTQAPPPPTNPPNPGGCKAVGAWAGNVGMDAWCKSNCAVGNCPPNMCVC